MTQHYKKTLDGIGRGVLWNRPGTTAVGAGEVGGWQVVRLSGTFKAISYCHHSVFIFKGVNSVFTTNCTGSFSTFR